MRAIGALLCYLLTFGLVSGKSKEHLDVQLIKDFLSVLFDEFVPAEDIVEAYIAYKAPSTNDPMLVQESYDMAVAHIKTVRRDKEGWFFPS